MDAYSSGGGGKLKLKGSKVSDGRVKKKKSKKSTTNSSSTIDKESDAVAQQEEKVKERTGESSAAGSKEEEEEGTSTPASIRDRDEIPPGKTEAERRHEEMRRKRLQERLKREGVKTHKERVEELNKYLSRLSEHHDMPKIGPG